MHERPAFRSCLRCEYTEPTAPTTDAEYQSVNSLALVTHPDETEFDVQVMGEWGVAEEAIGFESNVTDIMQRRRA